MMLVCVCDVPLVLIGFRINYYYHVEAKVRIDMYLMCDDCACILELPANTHILHLLSHLKPQVYAVYCMYSAWYALNQEIFTNIKFCKYGSNLV